MTETNVLVTGGAGFFGTILVKKLLDLGFSVTSLDLNKTHLNHPMLTSLQGDIRNYADVRAACDGVSVVYHNIAQVPIAKDKHLFDSVNLGGAKVLSQCCIENEVNSLVYTSSSAIFGVPANNPVTDHTIPAPAEPYGLAKYQAEGIFAKLPGRGVNVSIVRPRTILGLGRLGIFQILFEWIYQGKNIPVLGTGDNVYQFIHADDLADACIKASGCEGLNMFNVGAAQFGSMRMALEGLIKHANTPSKVVGVNKAAAQALMTLTSAMGLSPLGPYHALMYGESMFFDLTTVSEALNFKPKYSNDMLFRESYDWYVRNRADILSGKITGSGHQSALKQGILSLVPYLLWKSSKNR